MLSEQDVELTKIFNNVDAIENNLRTPSKLTKFNSSFYNLPHLSPLRIHIPPNNCHNCFQCYPHRCSHLSHFFAIVHLFPYLPQPRR